MRPFRPEAMSAWLTRAVSPGAPTGPVRPCGPAGPTGPAGPSDVKACPAQMPAPMPRTGPSSTVRINIRIKPAGASVSLMLRTLGRKPVPARRFTSIWQFRRGLEMICCDHQYLPTSKSSAQSTTSDQPVLFTAPWPAFMAALTLSPLESAETGG